MPKSLGQIHTCNFTREISGSGDKLNLDLPGSLTENLQRMIRQGNYFKVVGIDMTMTSASTLGGGQITGYIRYYAPTRGRCNAFKSAFRAMRDVMTAQGIRMHENKLYDFRAPINNSSALPTFANQATLDGTEGLALRSTEAGASIFGVHNDNVRPTYEGASGDIFKPGFDTILQDRATGTDFVLNDTVIYEGNTDYAELDYETIPFTMSYTPDTTDLTLGVQWRPDPALYLAVLCGQMQVVVEEVNFDGQASDLNLDVAVHVAGWKSIMGDPDKKRRKGTRHKKKKS